MTERLSPIQLEALAHVREAAKALNAKSKAMIADILARAQLDEITLASAVKQVQAKAQVVLHFHPDRLNQKGQSVAEALLHEGFYRNQFETELSNGGLTAFRGGQRDIWEKRLFGEAYQKPHVTSFERPKYGALDLMNRADGPAPRFGSCYFRLNSQVSRRCSFTYQDSFYEPEEFGVIDELTCIIASILADVEKNGAIFGVRDLTVSKLLMRLSTIANHRVNYAAHYGRTLDDYIEAQIHGPIDLELDVQSLVADPSFQATETSEILELLCAKYNIDLDWHAGFKLRTSNIPSEFRGSKIPLLAQRIAGNGFLNTAMIGRAAVSLVQQPELWRDWGTYHETLQHIKQLWHTLAYYGQPFSNQ